MADLDPSAAALLGALTPVSPPPVPTPEGLRAAHAAGARFLAGPGEAVADVTALDIDGVPVRTYRPHGCVGGDAGGTVVYAHGGGWVVGTLDTYDTLCRALANRCGAVVASVGYTLAPERRHPHQVDEVLPVLRNFAAAGRVALAGDSAGGHLATLVAAAATGIDVRALALIYPVVAPDLYTPSAAEVGTGYLLTTGAMRWYWSQYLPQVTTDVPTDLLRLDLAALPPTLVLTAGYDPLRDEGLAVADALERAGVPVERAHYAGQMHGFVRATGQVPESLDALKQVGAFLAARLG